MTAMKKPTATVVKLKPETHARLQAIAKLEDRPMGEVVTTLIDAYEQRRFWKEVRASYARLKEDPVAWQDYRDEVELLEGSPSDGLTNEPPYFTPEEEQSILDRAASRTQGR